MNSGSSHFRPGHPAAAMGSLADPYALRCVSDLPPPFRPVFKFRYFNSLQSECFHVCFLSDVNMVISAPTGSGKTVLFELCILRLFSRFLSPDWRFNLRQGTLKTIYIAPSKALVQEKLRDWTAKLSSLGIKCLEMTGDNEFHNNKSIHDADLILTTPEKFDSVSRHGVRDGGLGFFCDISLVLIDEVHLLNDPRGAALEAVVSRIKMLSRRGNMKSAPLANVRFIAVSATIPNIEDIAEWLLAPPEGIKRFGEEMRPGNLTTKVLGYTPAKNDFLFERRLQGYIYVGFHNGGLCLKDRSLVEGLFLKGDLQVVCTTNTLAHGINLPAHTVVIKSTQFFNKEKGQYVEYERSMVHQMCGRAGRPPFDDTGTVIIMTRTETVHLYENILNGCEMVESQLLPCAVEHLNAEIVQLTNPGNYGIKREIPCHLLEKQIQDICVEKIHELEEYGLILTDEDGFLLQPLEPGRLMAKFYLKFDTMKVIVKASACCSLEDLLHIICQSAEITWIQLRRNEKKILNDINTDKEGRLLFHILCENGKKKKRIQTREEKIFLLANDCLTGDPLIHDLSLTQETNSICSNGSRIAKCMREYFVYKKSYRSAISSMILAKCLYQKLWESSPLLLKQLPGIGIVTAKALKTAGISTFESLAAADARKIELTTGRNYPFGNHIKELMSALPPKIDIHIEDAGNRLGKSTILVTLTRLSQAVGSIKRSYADMVVGSEEDNVILFHEKIRSVFPTLRLISLTIFPYSVKVNLHCPQNARVTLKVDLIFEEYVGLDVHKKHVISREDDLQVTKERGVDKPESMYNLPAELCLVSSRTTRKSEPLSHIRKSPLSKEVCVIEDDVDVSAPEKADNALGTRKFNNLASLFVDSEISDGPVWEVPSFDLLAEEDDIRDIEGTSISEPAETECKSATSNTIFDHICKKSKDFPTLTLSKSMDSSYEPLILKRKRSTDQFGVENSTLHAGEVTPMDSESIEARVSPTNTAEKCRRVLTRTSEKSRVLFAGTRDSPSEKSKMLITTASEENSVGFASKSESPLEKIKALCKTSGETSVQIASKSDNIFGKSKFYPAASTEESPVGFAGKRDSPLEKIKALCRTSDQNSLQFAAKSDGTSGKSTLCPTDKSKMLITTAEESHAGFVGEKDSPLEKIKALCRTSDQTSLQFRGKNDSTSGKSKICPSEKSKMLVATPEKSPAELAGKRDSPREKIKALCRTSDENSLQFAAKSGSQSEKIKFCHGSPLTSFQATQCTKQVRAADQSFNVQDYAKDILGKRSESEGGIFGCRSVFSFL
ncbi:hypothetical protein EJB05_20777, partial [Eragrostis curvula]